MKDLTFLNNLRSPQLSAKYKRNGAPLMMVSYPHAMKYGVM